MEDTLQSITPDKLEDQRPFSVIFPEHGGDLHALGLPVSIDSNRLLDFSVCLNPLGPPKSLARTIAHAVHTTQHYPSPLAHPLKEQLASHHSLEPDNFLVTHGSTQLIYTLPELWSKDKSVCIITPAFSEYEKAFESRGIETHFFPLDPEDGFDLQWERLHLFLNSIQNLGGVILGHPASPAGTLCDMSSLRKLIDFTTNNHLHLVVDETFIDFTDRGRVLIELLPENPLLILVRTFTKFFSIPGIRLGYGIMSAKTQKQLGGFLPPWSVGSLEIEVGRACLEESEYKKASRAFLIKERTFLSNALGSLKGIKVFPSESCSLLFQLTEDAISPEHLFTGLLQDGILIRNCGNFRGLDHRFFRTGIRSREENGILVQGLRGCVGMKP